jgi:D-aminopeptidase
MLQKRVWNSLVTALQDIRQRPRDLGVVPGILQPGRLNSITDVAGVRVGHETVIRGDSVRTGVTAILPHDGNIFREKVPGAIFVQNGFGKLTGISQVNELGEIETPILLTNTLSVHRVADALVDYVLSSPGNEEVVSVNPVVAETNDGFLNDIRLRQIGREEALSALHNAVSGPVQEGSIGAGTGIVTFGYKGGIGTSSRILPASLGNYTVGVLVQANFDGILSINGAPVGRELGKYYLKEETEVESLHTGAHSPEGSVVVVVATDAPVDSRNLRRLASRSLLGIARTGSISANGSGDYAISFSPHQNVRIMEDETARSRVTEFLGNESMSPLFLAAVEATEEAVYNSLFKASTMRGREGRIVEALPIDSTLDILHKYNAMVKEQD